MYYSPPGPRSSINSIPRDPITLSEDDGGVQSPPQQGVYVPWPFSEGDWDFLENRCEWVRLTDETELYIFEQSLFGLAVQTLVLVADFFVTINLSQRAINLGGVRFLVEMLPTEGTRKGPQSCDLPQNWIGVYGCWRHTPKHQLEVFAQQLTVVVNQKLRCYIQFDWSMKHVTKIKP